jgi:hypothetical protein
MPMFLFGIPSCPLDLFHDGRKVLVESGGPDTDALFAFDLDGINSQFHDVKLLVEEKINNAF